MSLPYGAPDYKEDKVSQQIITLPEVDEVKVTIVVDNSIDMLLPSSDVVQRYPLGPQWVNTLQDVPNPWDTAIAEHGYSALIEVTQGNKSGTLMYDTGVSAYGLLRNIDALGINARDIRGITISHGHPDHSMGLLGLVDRLGSRSLPLVLHPDAYLERKVVLPDGHQLNYPPPRKSDYRAEDIEVIEEVGPSMLVDGMTLVSGEISRINDFETGNPYHHSHRHGRWEPDPLISDDQCVIVNVRGKGLVIITGCGHSGIINTLHNAQHLTGVQNIYALIGGFHLSGSLVELLIPRTVSLIKEIGPRYIMPGHCTGWSACHQLATAMPDAFVASSVGTTLTVS